MNEGLGLFLLGWLPSFQPPLPTPCRLSHLNTPAGQSTLPLFLILGHPAPKSLTFPLKASPLANPCQPFVPQCSLPLLNFYCTFSPPRAARQLVGMACLPSWMKSTLRAEFMADSLEFT